MQHSIRIRAFWAFILLIAFFLVPEFHAKEPKLKAEDIVAKHLATIGTPVARGAVKNRIVEATVRLRFIQGGVGQFVGKASILSEGRRIRFGMNYSSSGYPGDQLAFDGEKVNVFQFRPGERTDFSQFVYSYDIIAKEGLLGGVLSTAWPLLDTADNQPQFDYKGLKKTGGKQYHEVMYKAQKGGGDLLISLYFDAENFRHVRTQYKLIKTRTAPSSPGMPAGDATYTLTEQFDDFKAVDGLTFPHSYKIRYTIEGAGNLIVDWELAIDQISHNVEIDPKYFAIL
ncbi:MAG: hypothetical protein ABSC60_03395 [Acidobacteriota bacterium]|jgi:hypothetical protein